MSVLCSTVYLLEKAGLLLGKITIYFVIMSGNSAIQEYLFDS